MLPLRKSPSWQGRERVPVAPPVPMNFTYTSALVPARYGDSTSIDSSIDSYGSSDGDINSNSNKIEIK